jgi:hypothetical protein
MGCNRSFARSVIGRARREYNRNYRYYGDFLHSVHLLPPYHCEAPSQRLYLRHCLLMAIKGCFLPRSIIKICRSDYAGLKLWIKSFLFSGVPAF